MSTWSFVVLVVVDGLLSLIAWVLSLVSISGCDYVKVQANDALDMVLLDIVARVNSEQNFFQQVGDQVKELTSDDEVDAGTATPAEPLAFDSNSTHRGLGTFAFEGPDGACVRFDMRHRDEKETYSDFIGTNLGAWVVAASTMALFFFCILPNVPVMMKTYEKRKPQVQSLLLACACSPFWPIMLTVHCFMIRRFVHHSSVCRDFHCMLSDGTQRKTTALLVFDGLGMVCITLRIFMSWMYQHKATDAPEPTPSRRTSDNDRMGLQTGTFLSEPTPSRSTNDDEPSRDKKQVQIEEGNYEQEMLDDTSVSREDDGNCRGIEKVASVFLSHTGRDVSPTNLSEIVHERLQQIPNVDPFLDSKAIEPSSKCFEVIEEKARRCDVFVCFLSRHYFSRYWTMRELDLALMEKRPILPVHFEDDLKEIPTVNEELMEEFRQIVERKRSRGVESITEPTAAIVHRWGENLKELARRQSIRVSGKKHQHVDLRDKVVDHIRRILAQHAKEGGIPSSH